MPDTPLATTPNERLERRALEAFEASRVSAADMGGKANILWAAALAVVWLSGLESTRQSIEDRTQSFVEHNRVAQIEQRRIVRKGELIATSAALKVAEVERLLRDGAIENERAERQREVTERQQEVTTTREKQNKALQADRAGTNVISESDFRVVTEAATRAEEHAVNAEKRLEAFNKKINDLGLEDQSRKKTAKKTLETERQAAVVEAQKEISKQQDDFNKQRRENRERLSKGDRGVSFELAGFKFNAPPMPAPLLWSVFLLGLIGHLTWTRAASTAQAVEGFKDLFALPAKDGNAAILKIGRLPPWTMRSVLQAVKKETADLGNNLSWIDHVFGTRWHRFWSVVAINGLAWLALLFQTRVSWLALDFSHHLGSNLERALVPFAVLLVMAPTVTIACWWVGDGRIPGITSVSPSARFYVPSVLVLAGLFVILYIRSDFGVSFGRILQDVLPYCLVLPLPFLVVGAGFTPFANGDASRPAISTRRLPRRSFLAIATAASIAGISSFLLPQDRHPRFRLRKKPIRNFPERNAGFYCRAKSEMSRHPIVFHYVDVSHSMWRGGQLPSLIKDEKRLHTSIEDHFEERADRWQLDGASHPREFEFRVHLASSSWAFEAEAMRSLGQNEFRSIDSNRACELLLSAVKHDIIFKRSHGRPSFRLFDLLAGLAVRFQHPEHLEELIKIITISKRELSFTTRMEKWQDPKSSWWKRWRNRKYLVTWSTDRHAVVF